MMARVAFCLAFVVTGCARPDPQCQGQCDPLTEVCVAQLGCAFLQNGNPIPWGEGDSYSCRPLAERCSEDRTCECVTCAALEERPADCEVATSCQEPVDDGPVMLVFGCE